jgi:hypothetical protein
MPVKQRSGKGRRPQFSGEVVELFVQLERTPARQRRTQEFTDGSKRLARALNLSAEWWAGCAVEDGEKPQPRAGLVAHEYWLTTRRMRAALLEAAGHITLM